MGGGRGDAHGKPPPPLGRRAVCGPGHGAAWSDDLLQWPGALCCLMGLGFGVRGDIPPPHTHTPGLLGCFLGAQAGGLWLLGCWAALCHPLMRACGRPHRSPSSLCALPLSLLPQARATLAAAAAQQSGQQRQRTSQAAPPRQEEQRWTSVDGFEVPVAATGSSSSSNTSGSRGPGSSSGSSRGGGAPSAATSSMDGYDASAASTSRQQVTDGHCGRGKGWGWVEGWGGMGRWRGRAPSLSALPSQHPTHACACATRSQPAVVARTPVARSGSARGRFQISSWHVVELRPAATPRCSVVCARGGWAAPCCPREGRLVMLRQGTSEKQTPAAPPHLHAATRVRTCQLDSPAPALALARAGSTGLVQARPGTQQGQAGPRVNMKSYSGALAGCVGDHGLEWVVGVCVRARVCVFWGGGAVCLVGMRTGVRGCVAVCFLVAQSGVGVVPQAGNAARVSRCSQPHDRPHKAARPVLPCSALPLRVGICLLRELPPARRIVTAVSTCLCKCSRVVCRRRRRL